VSAPIERPRAEDSPFLIPGRWYREHPAELLEAELDRRGLWIPPGMNVPHMSDLLAADDAANDAARKRP
jgi:hypothetical protein